MLQQLFGQSFLLLGMQQVCHLTHPVETLCPSEGTLLQLGREIKGKKNIFMYEYILHDPFNEL